MQNQATRRNTKNRAATMLEAALVVPLFLYSILALIDLSRYFFVQSFLNGAAQAGADLASKYAVEESLDGASAETVQEYRARVVAILNASVSAAQSVASPGSGSVQLSKFRSYQRSWYDGQNSVSFPGFSSDGLETYAAFLRPGEKVERVSDGSVIEHPTRPYQASSGSGTPHFWPSSSESWGSVLEENPTYVIVEANLPLMTLFGSPIRVQGKAFGFRKARQPGRPVSPLPEPTATNTASITPTISNTPTRTPTRTPTPTPTRTDTPTITNTPTSSPTATNTPTATDTPDCATLIGRPLNIETCEEVTPLCCAEAGAGCYATCIIEEAAKTADQRVQCMNCNARLGCGAVCPTPTDTPTPTITSTPSITPTSTDTPTPTLTPTVTNTPTPTNTPTVTPTPSITPTASNTPTPSNTATITSTPTPSMTPTSTPTPNCVACNCPADAGLRALSSCCSPISSHYLECQQCDVCISCNCATGGGTG